MLHMPSPIRHVDSPRRAVVAIGGNALTAEGQEGTCEQIATNAATVAVPLAGLLGQGWQVAVVHGNGPQVGNLSMQQDAAEREVPVQPLHSLCAMTQGQLGSVLVRAIDDRCGPGTAVAVVTHVRVDRDDPAFGAPTKPIGPFLTGGRATELADARGWTVIEDSGRGHRRVVASPRPREILEVAAICTLLDAGHVVLAAGGGGVAVAAQPDGTMTGADAVLDKDHSAGLLATAVGATELYLVTGVDSVQLDFGTPSQRPAHRLTPQQAERHLADGQFPPGSMGPKVVASLRFLADGGHRAIITSAERLADAAAGRPDVGTTIAPQQAAVGAAS
jgi:carbamate kinase